jgi:hypothetical protein
MLFQALSAHPALWSTYRESQAIIEAWFPLFSGRDSNLLTEHDLDEGARHGLERDFFRTVGNIERFPVLSRGLPLIARYRLSKCITLLGRSDKRAPIRIVEKTPTNSFRIPFLRALFADAVFLFMVRDPRPNIASIYRGWESTQFKTHPMPRGFHIEGYVGSLWSFGFPPGWQTLNGQSLIEVCAYQWREYNEHCISDLEPLGRDARRVRYEELMDAPGRVLVDVCQWAGLDPGPMSRFRNGIPNVHRSRPSADKWRSLEGELDTVADSIRDTAQRLGYAVP